MTGEALMDKPSLLNDRRSPLQVEHDDAQAGTVAKAHAQLANIDYSPQRAVVPVRLVNTVRKSTQSGPRGY
jgi:hypothetical protein